MAQRANIFSALGFLNVLSYTELWKDDVLFVDSPTKKWRFVIIDAGTR